MTLDKLDQLLAEWKSIMDTAAQNLVELHNLPSYEILIGASGSPKLKLAGVTERHMAPAMTAIEQLLDQFGLLSDTIQRANGLRSHFSRFPGWDRFSGSDAKVREIHSLLTQASIALPNPKGSFTAAPDGAITPRQLLAQMNESFRIAQSSLLEVDRIWKQLDGKLADAALFLNVHSAEASVDPLRRQVEALRARVITDPMGANADFDRDIQPVLDRTRSAVETLVQQRANVTQNLERGRELLRSLVDLRQEAQRSYTECKEKITAHAPPTPPLPVDRIAALYDWLMRLEAKLAEGHVDPVCIGLENWTGHVTELIAVEQRACAENRAPVELRRELRGRLSALKAKASARGLGEDAALSQLAARLDTLLHARPTPMREVTDLVSRYEARLNGRP